MVKGAAADALKRLMEGNQRFVKGSMQHPNQGWDTRELLIRGQKPFAAVLTCSDSRVAPEIIFDTGLGDIFVVRTAANLCDNHGLASVEYAVEHLKVPLVMVLGHTYCGALTAVVTDQPMDGKLGRLRGRLRRAVLKCRNMTGDLLNNATMMNVELEVERLGNTGPHISKQIFAGNAGIVGAIYDIASGEVEVITED